MFVNDELDTDVVHGQGAAEGTGFSYQYTAFLAQGAVDGLHDAGLPAALRTGPVSRCGQNTPVGFPFVRKVPRAATVLLGQDLPEPLRGSRSTVAQHLGHDAARVPLHG